jgi:hypothetical protein
MSDGQSIRQGGAMQRNAPSEHEPGAPVPRRQFLERAMGRSLAVLGIAAAAGAAVYEKPRLKSFSPETTAYAQTTGAGTFTLKGTS